MMAKRNASVPLLTAAAWLQLEKRAMLLRTDRPGAADESRSAEPLLKCPYKFALKLQMRRNEIQKGNGFILFALVRLLNEAQNLGRIARDNRIPRHVFGDDAARADNGIFADLRFGKNCGVGADGCALADESLLDLPVCLGLERSSRRGGSRISVIDEHDSMTNEDVVLNRDSFADEGVAGDFAVFSDPGILLDFNEGADLRIGSDFTAVEVDELR